MGFFENQLFLELVKINSKVDYYSFKGKSQRKPKMFFMECFYKHDLKGPEPCAKQPGKSVNDQEKLRRGFQDAKRKKKTTKQQVKN